MLFFNKRDNNSFLEKIKFQADKLFKNLSKELKKENIKIQIECILFYYFLTDLFMSENNIEQSERRNISDSVYEWIKDIISKFNNDDTFRFDLNSLFNNRIISYSEILARNNNDLSNDFFKDIYEYQVELISAILLKNRFSKYNPCPKTPLEASPKIMNLLLTSDVRKALIDNHTNTMNYISDLCNSSNIVEKKSEEVSETNAKVDLEALSKYEQKIYELVYDELQTHNENVKTDIFTVLYFLYCITNVIEFSDSNIISFIKTFKLHLKSINGSDEDLVLIIKQRLNNYLEKLNKKHNYREFFHFLSNDLANTISSEYFISESLVFPENKARKLTDEEDLKKMEIESRGYAASYKSIQCFFEFLYEIKNQTFILEQKEFLSEIKQLNTLERYKRIKEAPLLLLNEILDIYSFSLKDGYILDDITFYTIDPMFQRLSHLIIEKKIGDNKKTRFDYNKPLNSFNFNKYYINYLPCENEKRIFEYLLLQINLEDYMNIRPVNSPFTLITDENEIIEYKKLLSNNPIINKSFIESIFI